MSKKQFYMKPNQDPKTGQKITVGDATYNTLVYKYGEPPKITSPKTNAKIAINKGEYKKLIKEGYTDDALLYGKDDNITIKNDNIKNNRLPVDNMYEVMLRADLETTTVLCQSDKTLLKICDTVDFCKKKILYHFPLALSNKLNNCLYKLIPVVPKVS